MQDERPAMRVAVIGLGVMGAGMARHLAEVGYTITAYNRTRARAQELAPHGVTIAATPRDAAAASAAVILMLSDDHATRACTDGPDGVLAGLAPGTLVLQMATLAPETTIALAAEVRERGGELLDAPVMGSAAEAASGQLWILAGGDPATLERARPLLASLAQEVYYAGEVGQGARLKLANNLLGANLVTALAEMMALIEACGIDPALYARVLQGSNLGTRMLAGKANQMVAGDYTARFSIANEYKDVGLALHLAHGLGLHLHQGESVLAPFEEAMERGMGAQDIAAMRLLVR
jgi:3-hydroxyisobutyrate dehydrogenase-like beta-hydroxyacid dehydrogenase